MSLTAFASSASSASSSPNHPDALWEINKSALEQMESGRYPVRDGVRDCFYYLRTGVCRFGARCRFNHHLYRRLALATAVIKCGYPERIGEPECQFYLKTGTCKFGVTCKFHHPRDRAGFAGRASLNVLGYPLRPNEIECAYYIRNGQCKYGSTCKFHHPQPSNMAVSLRGSALYPPPIHSPTTGELPFSGVSLIPSSRWQSPSSYAPLLMPQGVLSIPWNTYTGQVVPVSAPENLQKPAGNSQNHGIYGGSQLFPERPGQPECKFYMKTGDCKFGALCKFHHPRERFVRVPDCVLSPLGFPLRPGEPHCVFYSRYGVCKFGPRCKFDHPMRVVEAKPSDDNIFDRE